MIHFIIDRYLSHKTHIALRAFVSNIKTWESLMLGDWLRVGNQVWLGKYWDSRAGGGRERAQVRREM